MRLRTAPDSEVQQVQVWQIWRQIRLSPNSAKNSCLVLVLLAVAESAGRRIFHLDTSSVPKGPHAVPKALGRRRCRASITENRPCRGLQLFHIQIQVLAAAEVLANL